jgi:hypothetical protein
MCQHNRQWPVNPAAWSAGGRVARRSSPDLHSPFVLSVGHGDLSEFRA